MLTSIHFTSLIYISGDRSGVGGLGMELEQELVISLYKVCSVPAPS